jgi:hypothetical protein
MSSIGSIKIIDFFLAMGGVAFLTQVILLSCRFSNSLVKIISRIPVIFAALSFSFLPIQADLIFYSSILISVFVLTSFAYNARFEARSLAKMLFMFVFIFILRSLKFNWTIVLAELLIFFVLFYLFVFEQTRGVAALIQEKLNREDL